MKITNENRLPEALVRIAQKTAHKSKPKSYGATTLLKGNCEIILTRRYFDELEEDVSDMAWAIFGTMFHDYIKRNDNTKYSEYKVVIPVSKSYFVGVIDLYDKKNNIVYDYKTSSVWKYLHKDYEDYRQQLLAYCWGLEKYKKIKCRTGKIIMFLKDYSQAEKLRYGSEYPDKECVEITFTFTDEDIAEYEKNITAKIISLENEKYYPTNKLSECSEKEKWTTPTTYAIYKNDNKTATKVCSSEDEANKYLESYQANDTKNKYQIVVRSGVDKKCESYCRVSEFCPFRKMRLENGNTNGEQV